MKQIQGGVTAAKGFEAAGVEAAIKYQNRKDMALIVSKAPCTVAGTFTSNVVKAAPVLWDKQIVEHSAFAQAVVVNSGIANACTGKQGLDCCEAEAKCAGELLGVPTDAVLVASTGVIGMQIPVDKITAGIEKLVAAKADTLEAGSDAAHAIMTTDTISKEIAIETQIGGKTVTLGGMCKGSGMIHPNMCTMLGFVTTDVKISKEMLQKCVSADVVDSFNMISVDGDTSTNDTLLVLANGMAGNEEITAEGEDYDNFCKALHEITTFLAKKMAGDGEGATALFETKVINAVSKEDARTLAKSVICSSLTKAAIFGHDANWGRILCALGYSGAKFDPENVDLYFESKSGKIHIFGNGVACDYSEEEATKILSDPEVTALVDMHMGEAEKDMEQVMKKAEVLIEALPYIQKFNRKIIVVKYGGSAMSNEELQKNVIKDVTLLKLVGFKPIIVHGGGKEISRWVGKVGKEAKFVNGLRVTDEETMEIAEMVLNKVNKSLVTMVEELGVKAVGVSGKDGGLLQVEKKYSDGQDIGYVGEITGVNPDILFDMLEKDYLPIIAPIGLDKDYHTYNINADDAACAIAKAVHAEKLAFLTDIEGLYKDINDKSTFISRLTASEAEGLIHDGYIGGGMLPKLNNCTSAIRNGVNRVHILDGRLAHCLLLEIFTNQGIGTAIVSDEE